MDRPDLDIDGLETAERAFGIRQTFVGAHDRRAVEQAGCDVGAHDVDAIEQGLNVDRLAPALDYEIGIGDGDVEMLGHLVAIDDLADGDADGIATTQQPLGAASAGLDLAQLLLGGTQQLATFTRPLIGQQRIAADHETLARIVERGDLRWLASVEQRRLQFAGVDELADRRCAQRGDEVEIGRLDALPDPRLGDHAAITNEHHAIEIEMLLQLGDLCLQRRGVTDIAFEDFDRDRAAILTAQKSEHDLQLAVLAVTIVPELGQFAGAALEIGRTDVVEHQRAVLQVAPGQRLLDALLLLDQPVKRAVKLLLIEYPEPERLAERTGRRLRVEQARRRKLRGRLKQAGNGHGKPQPPLRFGLPAALRQQPIEPELAQGPKRCCHMTMGKAALHRQRFRANRRYGVAAQHTAQRLDLRGRPIRQIGKRALADLVAVTIALPQQDRRRRVAIGNAFDVHGELESQATHPVKTKSSNYMGTLPHAKRGCANVISRLASKSHATSA